MAKHFLAKPFFGIALILLGLLPTLTGGSGQALAAPEVLGIRLGDHGENTRLVLDLSEEAPYRIRQLDDTRIAVDFQGLVWRLKGGMPRKGLGLIKSVTPEGAGGFTINLLRPGKAAKVFYLTPGGGNSWRFVVDLAPSAKGGASPTAAKGGTSPTAAKGGASRTEPQASPAKPSKQPPSKAGSKDRTAQAARPGQAEPAPPAPAPAPAKAKPVIVIDPGHGGVDPGAVGASGVYEKNIVLAMGRELKERLESGGRFKVVLTRDRDVFLKLRDRVAKARQAGGDLFVSLHADSHPNQQLSGLSVYTLSEKASDAEAEQLAESENKADLIAGIDLSNEAPEVANILIDLAQRETMNLSSAFASRVVTGLGQEVRLLSNTHRFAGFAVLKAPDVPSVLVELGYLSNPKEEQLLKTEAYRAKLANAIARAAESYFDQVRKAGGQ